MAYNKEAIAIILNVGASSAQTVDGKSTTFLDKEKECCTKLLQKKIFEGKKDEIALIQMGSEETQNQCVDDSDGYPNIFESFNLAIPNWRLVRLVNECQTNEDCDASWEEALLVAIEQLKRGTKGRKFGNYKIVMFASFAAYPMGGEYTARIIDELKNMEIELIVISDDIEFCFENDNDDPSQPSQAAFSQLPGKTSAQIDCEKLILQIIEETDGNLTSFDYLIDHLTTYQRRKSRPSFWYANLQIGKDLQMQIAVAVLIKHEQAFKFKMAPKDDSMDLQLKSEFFKNGEQIDLTADEAIKGYMVGSTPIAYDETLGIKKTNTLKGLRCLAFTKATTIPPQLLCGNGTYVVLSREGDGKSQKLFRVLVKAMGKLGVAMIAARVYFNGCKPKLQVLTPNLADDGLPALNMYELAYADQVHHWYFPQLCTKRSQPSEDQLEAIDELIDSMDLMSAGDGGREAFPFDKLVSPVVQHIYESVTKRALDPEYKVVVFDDRLQQALEVPLQIVQQSAKPRQKVKELFKLEEPKSMKKELVRKLCLIPTESDGVPLALTADQVMEDVKKVLEVGTVNPEEDYKTLLNQDLDSFPKVSEQLGNVLSDLIFRSMTDQREKVCDCMMTFREYAKFYGPYVYSDWIRTIKKTVVTRKHFGFWEDVVVRNRLGLISPSESEKVVSVTDEEAEEFYRVNVAGQATGDDQEDEADVDDLFGQMA